MFFVNFVVILFTAKLTKLHEGMSLPKIKPGVALLKNTFETVLPGLNGKIKKRLRCISSLKLYRKRMEYAGETILQRKVVAIAYLF